jgi:hypothetical protein
LPKQSSQCKRHFEEVHDLCCVRRYVASKGGMHFAQVGTICGSLPCFLRRSHGSCVGSQNLCDGCKAIAYGLAVVHDKVDEVVETR